MHPADARARQAPASRPDAERLLPPIRLTNRTPSVLPWSAAPEVVAPDDEVDPVLRQVAGALMTAIVEALAGRRSPAQLERWVTGDLHSLVGHLSRARTATDLRLRSIRVQAPEPDVIEVSAHLKQGKASRAAALRIEKRHGHWLCTRLEIALRPDVVSRAG